MFIVKSLCPSPIPKFGRSMIQKLAAAFETARGGY
jgi:hypothetical protein